MGKCIEGLYKVISEIVLYYTSRMDFDFYNVSAFFDVFKLDLKDDRI